jgi:hypothetical protein
MKFIVTNHDNHIGDAMCQMRGIKEWKERNPGIGVDYVTTNPMHWLMAHRTDLFELNWVATEEEMQAIIAKPQSFGYVDKIDFAIDWFGKAIHIGILKAWCDTTFGFVPSTDVPYFLTNIEDKRIAAFHHAALAKRFRSLAVVQLESPSSDNLRGFKPDEWEKVLDQFPEDCGIIYPTSIFRGIDNPFKPRKNLILLPGYSMGYTAELMKLCNLVFSNHGGLVMLAYAVGAKPIVQAVFTKYCPENILKLSPEDGINLYYDTHSNVNWDEVKSTIEQFV